MSKIYLNVGDSGISFSITDENGPTVTIKTSAWGNLNHELKFYTTNEGLEQIGKMFIEMSKQEFSKEYCYAAKPPYKTIGLAQQKTINKGNESPYEEESDSSLYLKESLEDQVQHNAFKNLSKEELMSALKEANEMCRSAYSIAERQGKETNWDAFSAKLSKQLDVQHKIIYPKHDYEA